MEPKGFCHSFGCTSIINGQYVVLFGSGMGCEHYNYNDDILIYSVRDKQLKNQKLTTQRRLHIMQLQ